LPEIRKKAQSEPGALEEKIKNRLAKMQAKSEVAIGDIDINL
jgi:hypothetical protein